MTDRTAPILLALESSTSLTSVALLTHEGRMAVREDAGDASKASDTMMAMIDALLAECGINKNALQAIAYGQGPGAFTGLRTACAVAQGIAFGLHLPTIAVTSLEAVAEQCFEGCGATHVMAVMDARMNEVYAQSLTRNASGLWQSEMAIQVVPVHALQWPAAGCWHGAGNAWHATELSESLREHTPAFVKIPVHPSVPNARHVAQLASQKWAHFGMSSSEVSLKQMMAEPLYVRDKVAQTTAERLAFKELSEAK